MQIKIVFGFDFYNTMLHVLNMEYIYDCCKNFKYDCFICQIFTNNSFHLETHTNLLTKVSMQERNLLPYFKIIL